jgi:hypothetical protein
LIFAAGSAARPLTASTRAIIIILIIICVLKFLATAKTKYRQSLNNDKCNGTEDVSRYVQRRRENTQRADAKN